MTEKIKALLSIECVDMRNPKLQRARFDETMVCNSWIFQENESPVFHESGFVSTTTLWGRTFSKNASEKKIQRQVKNLLDRAAKYADIVRYEMTLNLKVITSPDDDFQGVPVLLQDD